MIGLTLRQLIDAPCVTRILVADGPHRGITFGTLVDKPTVKEVVQGLRSPKIVYQYTDDCTKLGEKCNRILQCRSRDCGWILVVDADEVYHEDGLKRLGEFVKTAEYGRYSLKTLDLYPDFHHFIKIPDWKPRLYQWFDGARFGMVQDDDHQYLYHPNQKGCPTSGLPNGLAKVPTGTCTFYHLNALRDRSDRVKPRPDGTVMWHGGNRRWTSQVFPFDIRNAPKSIRDLKRRSL